MAEVVGAQGRPAKDVVTQSWMIHPDWDFKDHVMYLVSEEFFEPGYVETLPVAEWLESLKAREV